MKSTDFVRHFKQCAVFCGLKYRFKRFFIAFQRKSRNKSAISLLE